MTFIRPRGVRAHDESYSPEALWQLDRDLLDATGNGHTLTVEVTGSETEKYGAIGAITGFQFDGLTNLIRNTADAGLVELGDMTLEMLVAWHGTDPGVSPNNAVYLATHQGATGTVEADNMVYSMRSLTAREFRYLAEEGSGTNIQYDTDDAIGAVGQVLHYAMRRASDEVTFFVNGVSQGTSAGLNAPTGGGSGRFRLGSTISLGNPCFMTAASVKFLTSALTDDQILGEARRCLG